MNIRKYFYYKILISLTVSILLFNLFNIPISIEIKKRIGNLYIIDPKWLVSIGYFFIFLFYKEIKNHSETALSIIIGLIFGVIFAAYFGVHLTMSINSGIILYMIAFTIGIILGFILGISTGILLDYSIKKIKIKFIEIYS